MLTIPLSLIFKEGPVIKTHRTGCIDTKFKFPYTNIHSFP